MIDTLFPLGWAHYLAGGLLLGAAVGLLFATTGLIGGMSTVFTSTWSYLSRAPYFQQPRFTGSRLWRLVFALGLVLGAFVWWRTLGQGVVWHTAVPGWRLLLGGVIAGFGARLSGGCTSGHGICGLASLQLPSLLAVLTFLFTAIVTAQLMLRLA
ncbi:MAG: YeeE/YedE family protein [Betaproteobacteria bacterium]|nr:YeeE/YedE family protein [Betaproteobacteria bacterium]MDE2047916.1 YeeE/YedE family protein [Betaproteobacteria bacterium]